MINSLNSEARLFGLSLFQYTSFRNVTALDLNFEYRFCKRKMKLNQQWNLQKMFSSVHDVHLCTWLIRPTPLKRKMSKDQLGFIVWMTACSLRLSFTSSIASGLAPRSSAVRQTRALSFQQSFHFFFLMNYLQICMQPCNLPDLFISCLSSFFRSLNRLFPYMSSNYDV